MGAGHWEGRGEGDGSVCGGPDCAGGVEICIR